jgi:hypothetical protein
MFLSLSIELGLKRHLSSNRPRFELSEDKTVSPAILLPVGAVRGRQATPRERAGDNAKPHAHQVRGISSVRMRWFAQRPRLQLAFEFCYFVLQSVSSSTV